MASDQAAGAWTKPMSEWTLDDVGRAIDAEIPGKIKTPDSNLTTSDPVGVALPTWKECEEAVDAGTETALHQFIYSNEPAGDYEGEWRSTLSTLIAEIRAEERERDRWMPIETAPRPKVGERRQQVLLISQYPSSPIWTDTVHGWWDAFDNIWARWKHQWPPSHWMYVPEPPSSLPDQTTEDK